MVLYQTPVFVIGGNYTSRKEIKNMTLNIDYPPESTGVAADDAAALREWCVMLLEELNVSLNSIGSGIAMADSEKVVNWK